MTGGAVVDDRSLPTDPGDRAGLAPLRRRPKRLDRAPEVFRQGRNGPVVAAAADRAVDDGGRAAGGQGVLVTARVARQRALADLLEDAPPDPGVAAMARTIARRLSVRRRAADRHAERGVGPTAPLPFRHRSDDIDLDRTVEVLAERPRPEDTDIVVREGTSSPRAAVLVVDVSGSMRGEKARIAVATVAALSAELAGAGDHFALVAFWSDAAVLKPLSGPATTTTLLDHLLRIPARGLTNVGFGLSVGRSELVGSGARRRVGILLTDAVHNAGPDPRRLARRFPELHVLLETDGEHDAPLARDIARLGRGTVHPVHTHRDVAPALNRILRRSGR